MKKYWVYFITGIKSESAYKADFVLSMAADMVYFFISFIVWKTIYFSGGISEISNYSLTSTITYFFITSLIFRLDPSNFLYLSYSIWSGYFTNDLIKPWYAKLADPIIYYADAVINFLLYIPLMFFMIIFAHDFIMIPNLMQIILFIGTMSLTILFSLLINLCLHALTFYWGDQETNTATINYIIAFLAGGFLPIAFLPAILKNILYALPFKFLFDTPINIYLGKIRPNEVLGIWGQMIIWIIITYIIFHYIFKFGLKRYSGVGR